MERRGPQWWTERIAQNEAAFRRANEKLRELFEANGGEERYPFLCECGDPRCTAVVRASIDDYATVREHPSRFLIVPPHRQLDTEHVIDETDEFQIIEKIGPAGEIVRTAWFIEADEARAPGEPFV